MVRQAEALSLDDDDDWEDLIAERTYLVFELASERYALPVAAVGEVLRVPEVAVVPDTPKYICGAVNLRGGVVPVIDLRIRFGLPPVARSNRQVLILVEHEEELAALLVDAVKDAVEIEPEGIDPAFRSASNREFVKGLTRRTEGPMEIVLDIAAVLGVASEA